MKKPEAILINGANPSQTIYGANGESVSVGELLQNPAKYYAVYSSFYANAAELREYYGKNWNVSKHGDSNGAQRVKRAQIGESSYVVVELGRKTQPTVAAKTSLFDRIKR